MKQEIKIQLIQYTDETQDEICGLLVRKGFEVRLREDAGVKGIQWRSQNDMFSNRIVRMGEWLMNKANDSLYFYVLSERELADLMVSSQQ